MRLLPANRIKNIALTNTMNGHIRRGKLRNLGRRPHQPRKLLHDLTIPNPSNSNCTHRSPPSIRSLEIYRREIKPHHKRPTIYRISRSPNYFILFLAIVSATTDS